MACDVPEIPQRRVPDEPERVMADDRLVEAARSGRLSEAAADPLVRFLALLETCRSGRCRCPGRQFCLVREDRP